MPRRVVCIEDEADMIELINLIVAREGFEFHGIRRGMDGLETVKREKPDLVLLDLMMPDLDGWTIYDRLKENPETEAIPIIIVTARGYQDPRLLTLRAAHAETVVSKPFGPKDLIDAINRALTPPV